MIRKHGSIVVGLAALLAACHHAPPSSRDRLWAHYARGNELVTAVIDGDLARARNAGRELAAEAASETQSAGDSAYAPHVLLHARQVAEAADIPAAAAAAGELAQSCGGCHQARGLIPRYTAAPVPTEGRNAIQTQMRLHLWAADRMWDGLVLPSDSAWAWGARTMGLEPLYQFDVGLRTGNLEQAQQMAQRVFELGGRARRASDPAARAGIYGEFLAACASCHRVARWRRSQP